MPLSQRLIDAENAHKLAIWAGRHNLLFSKRIKVEDEQILVSTADLSLVCCKKKNTIQMFKDNSRFKKMYNYYLLT